ncbi:hypothetical protein Misp01_48400 [Microtetraspora sp. NBRC 13810]|uniref:winged helix DNA-binding domain-containing protein n=1 Tax=Microtetraspora sp. NBRC 13810 TaxID=3030990 RepID=UPI0024A41E36|nr:winged helix DNA-binding domain-containing protein [Microtetraspora sp. NBRC 13810]GLW09711.1 hypothetical protein Misp01_48400 [Microtetraspora sp. NBRC 13810]
MRRIGVGERRARLGVRHRLARESRAASAVEVARSLVALHATDPATVVISALARLRAGGPEAVESALYEERTLVRLLGMRRTVFVVPVELGPVVQASSTRALIPGERRRLVRLIEEHGIAADGDGWLAELEDATVRALAARGPATAAELAAEVPGLREEITMHPDKSYGGRQRLTGRVLFLLSAAGRIVRGRPGGSWLSSQYQWATAESWLPGGTAEPAADVAQAELLRHWLAAFGPATSDDVRWWTRWTVREVRRALAKVGAAEVELDDGTTGYVLADDLEPVAAPEPWAALLPALDATPMGWAQRDWYLGGHRAALFDRTGNIGPTVWWEGRIVGGWAQRKDGEVVFRMLEDAGAEAVRAVEHAAGELRGRLGGIQVTPRFRTPLEKELTG